MFPILSLLIFMPVVLAALVAVSGKSKPPAMMRVVSVIAGAWPAFFAIITIAGNQGWLGQNPIPLDRLNEFHAWIPAIGANYSLSINGVSLILILLTGIITPMCLLASRKVERPHLFNALFLLMQACALGVFCAKNFVFWFLFWELSLFPAFFLIKLWGDAGATRAAYQFVIYTIAGGALMLLSFIAIFAITGTFEFSGLFGLSDKFSEAFSNYGNALPVILFFGVLIGLAVKVPMFPFHTWLPATYTSAPTGVSMFLTAILSKMGVFAFVAILAPIFGIELAQSAPWLIWFAVAGVVFGAYAVIRQTDLKRMVAYSSINHLSYCLLALFALAAGLGELRSPEAWTATTPATIWSADAGIVLQMFNHGLSAAALFFCVGVLEARTGKRGLNDFGGVRKVAPVFAALCGVSLFSSLGLPGLNGFVGEFLIFRGSFAFAPWPTAVSCLGLLGTALFLLTFWQKVFHGPVAGETANVSDLSLREIAVLAPAIVLMFVLGVYPQLLINLIFR